MMVIKGTTKKGENMLNSAKYYDGFNLSDVYGKFSHAKAKAWEWCYNLCRSEEGRNFHITSHNSFGFVVAWEVDTGIRIETANNSYLVLYPQFCR